MNHYPCEMIQDLLPLYHDGVCAEETAAAVEEHLAGCEDCQAAHQRLLQSDSVEPEEVPAAQEEAKAKSIKRVRGRFRRRAMAICLLVVLVLGTAVLWLNTATLTLPPSMIDGVFYGHKPYSSTYHLDLRYDTLLGSKYYSIGTAKFMGATIQAPNRDGSSTSMPVLLFSKRITLWDSICYDLTNREPEGYQTDGYAMETVPGAWSSWRNNYIGNPPPIPARHQPIVFSRVYFLPDYGLMERFADLTPEEQTKALHTQAVLVWEQ